MSRLLIDVKETIGNQAMGSGFEQQQRQQDVDRQKAEEGESSEYDRRNSTGRNID
jgi:hypothetical protein